MSRLALHTRLEREEAALAKVEEHIAAGQMRIAERELRIEALRAGDHDTTEAERFLRTLLNTLAEWNAHRDAIFQVVRRCERSRRS